MNVGLGNLSTLRTWLLPPELQEDTRFDNLLIALGQGVAGQIEKYCGRQFMRTVNAQTTFRVAQQSYSLPIYPVEALVSVEIRANATDDWEAQCLGDIIAQLNEEAGLIEMWPRWAPPLLFLFPLGGLKFARIRVTWTGGYWWNQLEPTDEGYPQTIPDGAAALPADLLLAWQMQCEFLWSRKDKLGVPLTDGVSRTRYDVLGTEPLSPQVVNLLNAYKRYQLI